MGSLAGQIRTNKPIKKDVINKIMRNLNYTKIRRRLQRFLLSKEEWKYLEIGRFRLSGEPHKWMYDEVSLKMITDSIGFKDFIRQDAFTSFIPNWESFELDSKGGIVHAPSSLFIECVK